MKIIDIKIKDINGRIIQLNKAKLIKNIGIQGDINAKGGNRQISILSVNTKNSIEKLKHKGLCIPRFFDNITIDYIDISQIHIGQKLSTGKTTIEISKIGKECFPNCLLVQEGNICKLSTKTIFAKVIKGGIISLNDILV